MTATERQLRDDYRAALVAIDRLRVERNAAVLEAERLRVGLDWIATQPCTMDAEGASEDTECGETGACASEWCLRCYARAVVAYEGEGDCDE